jgi:hypothetical protein
MYLFKKHRSKGGKHRKPTPYKAAFKLLVTVFSWLIRNREAKRTGKCFICGINEIQDCFHFIPSFNLAVRFELDNACGGCKPCNFGEITQRGNAVHDDKIRSAHVRMVGEARVVELEAMRRNPWKKTTAELLEMKRHFERLLAGEAQ